nr:hypothetical protein [Vibrio parahaemolyticus]
MALLICGSFRVEVPCRCLVIAYFTP